MPREMILLPYDTEWINRFKNIKKELSAIFGDLAADIQHFGSTAVIGMSAKPIIDVMVIVTDIQKVDNLNSEMQRAGYVSKGENGISGRRYFQKFHIDAVNHTQHIHCYEKNNQAAINELMFRDYLNINKEAFTAYLNVKMEASKKYRYSPQEYTEFKTNCVNEIMKQAKQYFAK